MATEDIQEWIWIIVNAACCLWIAIKVLPKLWDELKHYANGYKNHQIALFAFVHIFVAFPAGSVMFHFFWVMDWITRRPAWLSDLFAFTSVAGTILIDLLVNRLRPKKKDWDDFKK